MLKQVKINVRRGRIESTDTGLIGLAMGTRSSAIAEGPRDAIVSTDRADTRRRHIPRLT